MANPFVALESVPIMATITDMLQRQADLQRTQASTQLITQQSNILGQQIQSEKKFQEGLAQLATARQAKDASDQSAPQPFGPFGNSEMAKPIIEGYQSESQSAKQHRQIAQVAIDAGDYARQKQEESEAIAADNRAREWYTQGLKLAKDQREELASTAGSYSPDGSNLPDIVAAVKAVDPKLLNSSQFNRDGQGNIVPGTGTTGAMSTIADQSMKHADQLSAKREADKVKHDADAEAERIRHDKAEERHQDQELSQQRAALAARVKMHKETLAASGIKYDEKAIKDTQTSIDKLATDAKLGDFKAASDIAKRVEAKLVDPAQGYTSVTPEDARQLVEQAKRLQQNFRSFGSAGKMQESEIKNMNSFLEGYEKWVQSIGKGDPILAKDQMLNLTETMNKVYNDRNAEQVKQELQRTKILTDRGGRPDWVSTRGNVDDLKEAGRAFEVTVSGKQYLAIVPAGKTKKDLTKNDLFEIPQAPKAPSFVPIPE